jgi:hypothetical protein
MPCEHEDRDQGKKFTSRGTPKIASKLPDTRREVRTDSPSQLSERTNPTNTLISDLYFPQL